MHVIGGRHLARYGWDERVAALLADSTPSGSVPGRVVRVQRGGCTVTTGEHDRRARARVLPAVGDWVAIQVMDDDAVVVVVAERWSELARRDPEGRTQVLGQRGHRVRYRSSRPDEPRSGGAGDGDGTAAPARSSF